MPKPYTKRLLREYKTMKLTPPPHIVAAPLAKNLLEWHYCVYGLKDCPYEGGFYHGKLIFPEQYPFKPPGIMMLTPSGRFQPATRLCMSMSDYHPEQWNPAWNVESILKGLVSFMLEGTATAGSITTTAEEKERRAFESGAHNLKNPTFGDLFPEMVDMITAEHKRRENAAAAGKPDRPGRAAPNTPPSSARPPPGSSVQVFGLVSAAGQAMNGVEGTVQQEQGHVRPGRVSVLLAGSTAPVAIKADNLRLLG